MSDGVVIEPLYSFSSRIHENQMFIFAVIFAIFVFTRCIFMVGPFIVGLFLNAGSVYVSKLYVQ